MVYYVAVVRGDTFYMMATLVRVSATTYQTEQRRRIPAALEA